MYKCTGCEVEKADDHFYVQRSTKRGLTTACKICTDERNARYRKNNKEKIRTLNAKWKANNPETKARSCRESDLKQKYGLSGLAYDRLFEAQQGKCAICGFSPTKNRALCVDHCHRTGRVRKLLCDRCNQGLGAFKDDLGLLRKAARYLEETE